jgi:hypothetical protein
LANARRKPASLEEIKKYLDDLPSDEERAKILAPFWARHEAVQQNAKLAQSEADYTNQEEVYKELEQKQMAPAPEDDYDIPPYTP